MPRIVAWIIRVIVIVPLLLIAGYTLIAPTDSPVRFGYRLFLPIAVLVIALVWQLTNAAEQEDSAGDSPGSRSDT